MKVLIIEDDRDTAEALKEGLAAMSYTVEVSPDGADGSFLARNYDYDAIVLDYSLPKKNGLLVVKDIRAAGKATPVIFLSSTADTEVKIAALEAGADDYITKPFSQKELMARLEALSRRPKAMISSTHTLGDLSLDSKKHKVVLGSTEIPLTRKEFGLLEYFMKNPGIVLSRSLLMEHVWTAESDPFSNTVEAHIRNVRKKLREGGAGELIRNVPGRGYVLEIKDTEK